MGINVTFSGISNSLLLVISAEDLSLGWTQLFLSGENTIPLGAQIISYVVPRISKILDYPKIDDISKSKIINGCQVQSVLLLAETHVGLYAGENGDGINFIWQSAKDGSGAILGTIEISKSQIAIWKSQLTDLREEWQTTDGWIS